MPPNFNTASRPSWLVMPDSSEVYMAIFDRARVLSGGIMVGTAMFLPVLPAIQYEDDVYRYLLFLLFGASTIVHNALIWEAVVDYFFLALVTTIGVILITLLHSGVSVSFLLGRVPLLIASMSLFVEECSRRFGPNSRQRKKAPDPKLIPPDAGVVMDEQPVFLTLSHHSELLSHMYGGETRQYNASSQHSSEISLSNVGPGRLPSSCDSMVRIFWRDEPEGIARFKRGEERDDEESLNPDKGAWFW
ncbi:uncharacterized protein F4812DRAFT_109123 [Daldinia caldariorum]|uniref:uncharacterized protein n=1 Tax=Daldinia caldariorum TaxID=326644 RepID=UPI0020087787|nr:uncharacterized protein F4812DRAFT_109123 [Daldinia caldariorum]KAI1465712.1 hypothetical protein F4812DRAFT_109123 [Daldinia caldariorum]